ncbi:MAG: hypothetical protein MUO88_19760 [Desulfobacterales bacterium]|nr:hypothetical protein [Desulfobacterales bacterium]
MNFLIALKKRITMRNHKILILSFFTILCFAGYSLAEVRHWNQIDTDDLTQVEIKGKYYDLLKHNKAELTKTIKQCLEVINQDDDIMRNEVKKEWKKSFLTSQNDWEKSIESDKKIIEYDHCGGSGTEIFILKYQIGKTIERIKELKERFCLN